MSHLPGASQSTSGCFPIACREAVDCVMPKGAIAKDLTGHRFGRLTVVARAPNNSSGCVCWACRCECGTDKVISRISLRSGDSNSCGCFRREVIGNRQRRHGMTNKREWVSWSAMQTRCFDPKHVGFKYWGGRGITVCDRWRGRDGFVNFLADLGTRPPMKSLDRIDPNGHYEPGNCRWADAKTQATNKRARACKSG